MIETDFTKVFPCKRTEPVKVLASGYWIGLPPGEYVVALSPSIDPPSFKPHAEEK